MTTHTPGPWLQSWDCWAPTGSDASPKYDGFEVVNDDGWPVAFVPIHFVSAPVKSQQTKREIDWDEASANLRLISAAPCLLAACIQMCNHYSGSLDHQPAYVAMARAAIAKATGGTT